MKTKSIIAALMGTMLIGCVDDTSFNIESPMDEIRDSQNIASTNSEAIKKYITHKNKETTRAANYLMTPYIVGGDTVMHIVNYGENSGWEIFSNNTSVPMVLFQSDKGSFYPIQMDFESPFGKLFNKTAEILIKKDAFHNDSINPEWIPYIKRREIAKSPNSLKTRADVDEEEEEEERYQWIYSTIPEEKTTTYTPMGGRLVTEWDQIGFYNNYTPFCIDDNTKHSPVGCIAVAMGQFFYYTHYNVGFPKYSVTSAVYDESSNTYNFSGSSVTIWDAFAKKNQLGMTYVDKTAIFLGNLAKSIRTSFGKIYDYKRNEKGEIIQEGSGQDLNNSICRTVFKNETGLNIDVVDISKTNVISNFEKGYPTIAQAFNNDKRGEGHAFIIDAYKNMRVSYTDYYIKVPKPSYPDTEDHPDYSEYIKPGITLEELEEIFGTVYSDYQYYVQGTYYINWGWGGQYNEIGISADLPYLYLPDEKYDVSTGAMYLIK